MDKKDKWIEETENSLDGFHRAEPKPFLFTRIQARLIREKQQVVTPGTVWLTASALLFLVLFNLLVIFMMQSNKAAQSDMQSLARQMQLMNSNNFSYN